MNSLENISGPVDMIFIDADKAGYPKYLDWAEANVKNQGLIVGDNTFLFGHMPGEDTDHKVSEKQKEAMSEFNKRLANPEKYQSVLVPTPEGMTVAIKNF